MNAPTLHDLKVLCANRAPESRTIEFKLRLKIQTDKDKKEFLADVSAFSNTLGGRIIYGIREKDGAADALLGMEGIDQDQETLRIENLLRTGLQPALSNCKPEWVVVDENLVALVLHIPRRALAPHRVTIGGTSRFYRRADKRKYELDTAELRHAFLESEEEYGTIRDFRLERIGMLLAGESPVLMATGAKIVAHIVPDGSVYDDQSKKLPFSELPSLGPLGSGGGVVVSCHEGKMVYQEDRRTGESESYVIWFLSGIVESVGVVGLPDAKEFLASSNGFQICAEEVLIRQIDALINLGLFFRTLSIFP